MFFTQRDKDGMWKPSALCSGNSWNLLPRPKIESILNARPSIAVEQKNSVRNSRSTVGTMTELCDYFKVWFPQVAACMTPMNAGKLIKKKLLRLKPNLALKPIQ
jgi:excinuclease UvrABC ATPase subunit